MWGRLCAKIEYYEMSTFVWDAHESTVMEYALFML